LNDIEFHAIKDLRRLSDVVSSSHHGGWWSHDPWCKGLAGRRLEGAAGWHGFLRRHWVQGIASSSYSSCGVSYLHVLLLQGSLDFLKDLDDLEVRLKVGGGHTSGLDHAMGTLNNDPLRERLSFLESQTEEAVRVPAL